MESIYSFLIGWREWLTAQSLLTGLGILIGGLFAGWLIFMLARVVEAPQPQTATVADRPGVVRALPQDAAEASQENPAKAPRKPRAPKAAKPAEPMLLVDDAAKAGAA